MNKTQPLPFEGPIIDLEEKIEGLRQFSSDQNIDMGPEIERMQQKVEETRRQIYNRLTPWQRVQIARHPQRPYPMDYVLAMTEDFVELHGDRLYADDPAIFGGPARLGSRRIMVLGTRKGRDTRSNMECHFGCPFPEGYRKARRLMLLAARFGLPILSLIDTPGAYPGVEAEERHIAEAIAVNLREAAGLPVPIVAVVTGEGGSGGALGLSVGDRLMLLEHAYYSVISPEGCAAILWNDSAFAEQSAAALKITPNDLLRMGILDEVVPEPPGGAHADPAAAARLLGERVAAAFDQLAGIPAPELLEQRYTKLRSIGVYEE